MKKLMKLLAGFVLIASGIMLLIHSQPSDQVNKAHEPHAQVYFNPLFTHIGLIKGLSD